MAFKETSSSEVFDEKVQPTAEIEQVGEDLWRKRNENLLELVRSPPRTDFQDHLQLELPVFLDIETACPTKDTFESILQHMPRMNLEEAQQGLPNMIDGSKRPEVDKLLEMEPKFEPLKRKSIEPTISPSPRSYRTRAAARQEALDSPLKV